MAQTPPLSSARPLLLLLLLVALAAAATAEVLYAAGQFTTIGDVVTRGAAKYNGTLWSPLGAGFLDGHVVAELRGSVYADAVDVNVPLPSAPKDISYFNGVAWVAIPLGVVTGQPRSAAVYAGDLYVGGSYIGEDGPVTYNRIARWDGAAWSPLGDGVSGGVVNCLEVYNGRLIVGGTFSTVDGGGFHAQSIAAWDGVGWEPLGSGLGTEDNSVPDARDLVIYLDDLVVGGSFDTAGGVLVNNGLARWDGTAWSNFVPPNPTMREARALAVLGSVLFVASSSTEDSGTYTVQTWDGVQWSKLGGPGGALFTNVPNTGVIINTMVVFDNFLFVGGGFAAVNGVPLNNIAAWDGNAWSSFADGFDGNVLAFAIGCDVGSTGPTCSLCAPGYYGPPCTLCPAGTFAASFGNRSACTTCPPFTSTINLGATSSAQCQCAAGFTLDAGECVPCPPNTYKPVVGSQACLPCPPTTTTANATGASNSAQCKCRAGYLPPSPEVCTSGPASRLLVAGNFERVGAGLSSVGGLAVNATAVWSGTEWAPLGTRPNQRFVTTMAIYQGVPYTSGFTSVNGPFQVRVEKLVGDRWEVVGDVFDSGGPLALAEFNGALYAGGSFSFSGSTVIAAIAQLDDDLPVPQWVSVGSGMGLKGTVGTPVVIALAVFNDELYAGGLFTSAGGVQVSNLARWNGTAWKDVSGGANNDVRSLLAHDGLLWVGGDISLVGAGTVAVQGIATWDGTTWAAADPNAGFITVWGLGVFQGDVLVAAQTLPDTIGNQLNGVYRWNGATWTLIDRSLGGVGNIVTSVAEFNSVLYAAGSFVDPDFIAQLAPDGTWQPVGNGTDAAVLELLTWCAQPCILCPVNTYYDVNFHGMPFCAPCPTNSHTDGEGVVGRTSCICDVGWTGPNCDQPACEVVCAPCQTPLCRNCQRHPTTPPPPPPPPGRPKCQRLGGTTLVKPAIHGAKCVDLYKRSQYQFLTSAAVVDGTAKVPTLSLNGATTLIIEGYADAGCTEYIRSHVCHVEHDHDGL